MEAPLPSEIARLVFGYLEDQKCDEAARLFLEMSPHMYECRSVVCSGRRFNTRVNGLTLIDVIEQFAAANTLVQERMNKVADCDQLRHCGDLLEQLRFLLGGSRGQRFVVNINVPSQTSTQAAGGSPITSSSIRKRHHSGGDRDRYKRTAKQLYHSFEKHEPVSSQLGCDTVEATPLDSLPGHTVFSRSLDSQKIAMAARKGDSGFCTSTKNDSIDCIQLEDMEPSTSQTCRQASSSLQATSNQKEILGGILERRRSDPVGSGRGKEERDLAIREGEGMRPKGKSMATSTEELTSYSCVEVQTTSDTPSESESTDEPIENLSLLTKELLNRTELQERIAENINKAILPVEAISKDESLNESLGGELNTSIMTELSNAIKSIVAATETDPVFEQFLDEIIGPSMEADTSPDEEADAKLKSESLTGSTRAQDEHSRMPTIQMGSQEANSNNGSLERNAPMKQRLRSSSRQQNNRTEDEGDRQKDRERRDSSLNDQNEAAILSIINIIDNQPTDCKNAVSERVATSTVNLESRNRIAEKQTPSESKQTAIVPIVPENQVTESTSADANNATECKTAKNPLTKRPKPIKPALQSLVNDDELITEQEMMAMPTLIICSKEEMSNFMTVKPLYVPGNSLPIASTSSAQFIPIAPKVSVTDVPVQQPMYLRTVNVPSKTSKPVIIDKIVTRKPKDPISPRSFPSDKRRNCKVKRPKNAKPSDALVESVDHLPVETVNNCNPTTVESITLYGNENSAGTTLETRNLPTINLDESISVTGTGLSPFLKFKDIKDDQTQDEPAVKETVAEEAIQFVDTGTIDKVEQSLPNIHQEEDPLAFAHSASILLTKRTPKTLLKSRSKNKRLSLSTPRRRSSHIRALDFNTPMKMSTSDRKGDGIEGMQFSPKSSNRSRSVCRTSLFKSPPFPNPMTVGQKLKTPTKSCQLYEVPIATRSPTTKLMGGWEKYTGVGMILGGTSPHSTSATGSSGQPRSKPPTKLSRGANKKCWDADLRKGLNKYQESVSSSPRKTAPKKGSARGKSGFSKTGVKVNKAALKKGANEKSDNPCSSVINDNKLTSNETIASCKNIEEPKESVSSREHNADSSEVPKENSSGQTNVQLVKNDIAGNAMIRTSPVETTANSVNIIQPISSDAIKIGDKIDTRPKEADKMKQKQTVKKYAQLKTLATNISKPAPIKSTQITADCAKNSSIAKASDDGIKKKNAPVVAVKKKSSVLKLSPELTGQVSQMPHMMELETPRKMENSFGIPPTPRVLSPSSNTDTPFPKATEDSSQLRSFISTPEFPPTPSIALTPKATGDDTTDGVKKGEYTTCSPYYEPSTEQPDVLDKLLGCPSNRSENILELLPEEPAANVEISTTNVGIDIANDFHISTSSSKLEITQFEVIKENLPREEAVKELKITATSKDSVDEAKVVTDNSAASDNPTSVAPKGIIATASEDIVKRSMNTNDKSVSESDNESTDSDTSSSSDSSSASSSSSSSSSMANSSKPFLSVKKCKKSPNKIYTDTSNDSVPKTAMPSTVEAPNELDTISPIMKESEKNVPHTISSSEKCGELLTVSPATIATVINSDVPQSSETNDIVDALNAMPPSKKCEESPLKVFPVTKTVEEVDASTKETPAKDEALLSEAHISETPSSSKSGIETLTNLTSKMSAFNTPEDHGMLKQSRLANKPHVSMSVKTKVDKDLPRIISMERILPNVSVAPKPPSVSEVISGTKMQGPNKLTLQPPEMLDGKLCIELEEKRQRLLAKLKRNPKPKPKPNLVSRKLKAEKQEPKDKDQSETVLKNKHCTEKLDSHKSSVNLEPSKSEAAKKLAERQKGTECNIASRKGAVTEVQSQKLKQIPEPKNDPMKRTKTSRVPSEKKPSSDHEMVAERIHSGLVTQDKEEDSKKKMKDNARSKAPTGTSKVEQSKVSKRNEETEKVEENVIGNRNAKIKVQNRDDPKMAKLKTTVKNKEKDADAKKKESDSKALDKQEIASVGKKKHTAQESVVDKPKVVASTSEEEKSEGKTNVAVVEKPKGITKSKVDQVKRDLFSDEEINDQRKTRSRTRQISEVQKSEDAALQATSSALKAEEKIPEHKHLSSVLESLKLIPAKKSVSKTEETKTLPADSSNVCPNADAIFVYDYSAPVKKKKHNKWSGSELRLEVEVEDSDQNDEKVMKTFTTNALEEIYNFPPMPKKRVATRKPLAKTTKSTNTKTGDAKKKTSTPNIIRPHLMKPLATSSPVVRPETSKMSKIKGKPASTISMEAGNKLVGSGEVDTKEKGKDGSKVAPRKRKLLDSEANEQGEKKQRLADPQFLLTKLDLDKFLTSVHGPT